MTKPTEPPEKRASVISATTMPRSRHSAVMREVGSSISGISRSAARALVAHDDHVVVLKAARVLVERVDQALLTLEDAGVASEDIVLEAAFVDLGLTHDPFVLEAIVDAGELQDCGEIRREIAAEHA